MSEYETDLAVEPVDYGYDGGFDETGFDDGFEDFAPVEDVQGFGEVLPQEPPPLTQAEWYALQHTVAELLEPYAAQARAHAEWQRQNIADPVTGWTDAQRDNRGEANLQHLLEQYPADDRDAIRGLAENILSQLNTDLGVETQNAYAAVNAAAEQVRSEQTGMQLIGAAARTAAEALGVHERDGKQLELDADRLVNDIRAHSEANPGNVDDAELRMALAVVASVAAQAGLDRETTLSDWWGLAGSIANGWRQEVERPTVGDYSQGRSATSVFFGANRLVQ